MFANGAVDVQDIDGNPYINLEQTIRHLVDCSAMMLDDDIPESDVCAEVLSLVAATLAEVFIFHRESSKIDNVDSIVQEWSK